MPIRLPVKRRSFNAWRARIIPAHLKYQEVFGLKSSLSVKVLSLLLLSPIILLALAGCSGASAGQGELAMASMDGMPDGVKSAPTVVQQAYQFASANPDLTKQIPCYCGCDDIGHSSNYACYISGVDENGRISYDAHALGCSICVDITQDVMRLTRQGQGAPEIKTYIDQTFSQYGPSNMP
jgi:hypothetical protein